MMMRKIMWVIIVLASIIWALVLGAPKGGGVG